MKRSTMAIPQTNVLVVVKLRYVYAFWCLFMRKSFRIWYLLKLFNKCRITALECRITAFFSAKLVRFYNKQWIFLNWQIYYDKVCSHEWIFMIYILLVEYYLINPQKFDILQKLHPKVPKCGTAVPDYGTFSDFRKPYRVGTAFSID